MRIIPLSEVLKMEPGETVASIRATVKAIFDRNTGTNSHGDWSLQGAMLIDASGVEIKAVIKDRDPIPAAWKNKSIIISCHNGDKGLTGIKAKDDEYRGKVTRILSVTPSAVIELAENTHAESEPEPEEPPARTEAAPAKSQTTKPAAEKPANGGHESDDLGVKQALNRMANLYLHCLIATDYVRKTWEEREKRAMPQEQVQAVTSALFIQSTRQGMALQCKGGKFEND